MTGKLNELNRLNRVNKRTLALALLIACFGVARAQDHRGGENRGGSFSRGGRGAEHIEHGGTSFGRGGGFVDRSSHGSIRHFDTHVTQRPVEIHRDVRVEPRHEFWGHRDVDVDFGRHHFWNDFAFHRRIPTLPLGFLTLNIGGNPYYYSDGIYYQPYEGGYQEVYPPVGADVPQPPDGSIPIQAGGVTYYYAGGAFYMQQPDGTYAIAPTPIGVVVPELPPGAVQVSLGGQIAYQFNNIYYRPVFMNGVTQYETFQP